MDLKKLLRSYNKKGFFSSGKYKAKNKIKIEFLLLFSAFISTVGINFYWLATFLFYILDFRSDS